MRTTVTLDKDVEHMLRDAMHRARQSFKATLNNALRAGLRARTAHPGRSRFVAKALPMSMRAGIDPSGFNRLADELEAESTIAKARRGNRG